MRLSLKELFLLVACAAVGFGTVSFCNRIEPNGEFDCIADFLIIVLGLSSSVFGATGIIADAALRYRLQCRKKSRD
jgi:hypothetical protein